MRADFPARLRGEELAGVDMVMLDADIAGCVVTWQGNQGSLDEDRHQILLSCVRDLDKVLPLLTEWDWILAGGCSTLPRGAVSPGQHHEASCSILL
ncbi:hypothetical protein ACH40F_40765 [Streptomyces sp. NPDC020794]|uniref:hypothetical protein n=1 Tax=unclassified Streptomyces TaxID=2593676 RepID=UPI0036DFBC87